MRLIKLWKISDTDTGKQLNYRVKLELKARNERLQINVYITKIHAVLNGLMMDRRFMGHVLQHSRFYKALLSVLSVTCPTTPKC